MSATLPARMRQELEFEPAEDAQMLMTSLAESVDGDPLVIVLAFSMPLAMVVYALCVATRARRHARMATPMRENGIAARWKQTDEGGPHPARWHYPGESLRTTTAVLWLSLPSGGGRPLRNPRASPTPRP